MSAAPPQPKAPAQTPKPAVPHRPKNWLLILFRDYHSWFGVALSLVIITVSVTGIYLNHKKVFDPFLPMAAKPEKGMNAEKARPVVLVPPTNPPGPSPQLRTDFELAALPVSFERALTLARAELGDTPLERIELREEGGRLTYKVKVEEGRELLVDAVAGGVTEKSEMRDWGKFFKDLHTGKLGGLGGRLFIDFTSVVIVLLTLSGLYLWWVPIWRKRFAPKKPAPTKGGPKAEPQPQPAGG